MQEAVDEVTKVLRHAEDPATALATARRGLRESIFAIEVLDRAFAHLRAVRDAPKGEAVMTDFALDLPPLHLLEAWVKPVAKVRAAA